jgi:hypothetical protein
VGVVVVVVMMMLMMKAVAASLSETSLRTSSYYAGRH